MSDDGAMRWLCSVLCALVSACGITWRPALVVSADAVYGARMRVDDGRSTARWDVRAEVTFVLTPRATRPLLLREPVLDVPPRAAPPCVAAWLCAWERAARDEAIAGVVPALLEEAR